jgi:peptidoglycan hydrolase CwlO-like protein
MNKYAMIGGAAAIAMLATGLIGASIGVSVTEKTVIVKCDAQDQQLALDERVHKLNNEIEGKIDYVTELAAKAGNRKARIKELDFEIKQKEAELLRVKVDLQLAERALLTARGEE